MAKNKAPEPPKSAKQIKLEAIAKSIDREPDDWFDTYAKRVRDEMGPFRYIQYRHSTEGTVRLLEALQKVAEVLVDPFFYDAGSEMYLFVFHDAFAGEPLPEF